MATKKKTTKPAHFPGGTPLLGFYSGAPGSPQQSKEQPMSTRKTPSSTTPLKPKPRAVVGNRVRRGFGCAS